jgi:hypothetical protein
VGKSKEALGFATRVAYRYPSADGFLRGFSLRVRDEKHRSAGRIGEDPRRNSFANEYLHATGFVPPGARDRRKAPGQ